MEIKDIDFAALTEESLRSHPLYLRESQAWTENGGWTLEGYEPGPTCEASHIRLLCPEGHQKTVGAVWYLNGSAGFGERLPWHMGVPSPAQKGYGTTVWRLG
jgi:hypothetical protein